MQYRRCFCFNSGNANPPADIKSWLKCRGDGKIMDADLARFSYDIYAFGTQVCDLWILFYRFYYLAVHNKHKVDYRRDVIVLSHAYLLYIVLLLPLIGLPLTPGLCFAGYCPLLLFTQIYKWVLAKCSVSQLDKMLVLCVMNRYCI